MKILVTGAKGQVGQELVSLGRQLPCELFPLSKAELDITEPLQIEAAVKALKPTLLINTAAYTAVDKAEQEAEKAYAINCDGVKNLAQVCKRFDLPLIHLSTDYVFDGSKKTAYLEDDPRSPLSVYGHSKAAGEKILQESWEKHLIVRTSWVFGRKGPNFVKTILKLALKQKECRVVSDQHGCPTAASDLAGVLLKLAAQIRQGLPHWGIFHYRGERPTTWYEFAKLIINYGQAYFPLKIERLLAISTAEYPTPAQRPLNSVLDMSKIKKDYGIEPSSWEEALEILMKDLNQEGELSEQIST